MTSLLENMAKMIREKSGKSATARKRSTTAAKAKKGPKVSAASAAVIRRTSKRFKPALESLAKK